MAVLSNEIYSPQNYIESVTGNCYIFRNDKDVYAEIQNILYLNGLENLWDYPLTDIEHIVESQINVVLVDVSDYNAKTGNWVKEYRWFEVPENFCDNNGEDYEE